VSSLAAVKASDLRTLPLTLVIPSLRSLGVYTAVLLGGGSLTSINLTFAFRSGLYF
jgi:hypothetical protein